MSITDILQTVALVFGVAYSLLFIGFRVFLFIHKTKK